MIVFTKTINCVSEQLDCYLNTTRLIHTKGVHTVLKYSINAFMYRVSLLHRFSPFVKVGAESYVLGHAVKKAPRIAEAEKIRIIVSCDVIYILVIWYSTVCLEVYDNIPYTWFIWW